MSPGAEGKVALLKHLRRQVEKQHTNYVGQEGRGAARLFQREVLRTIDRAIADVYRADTLAASLRGGVSSGDRRSSSAIEGQVDSHRPDTGLAPSLPDHDPFPTPEWGGTLTQATHAVSDAGE